MNRNRKLYIPVYGIATVFSIVVLDHWLRSDSESSPVYISIALLVLIWAIVYIVVRLAK